MTRTLAAAIVAVALAAPADAETLLSKTFYTSGMCSGQDVVYPENMFLPWETSPIAISGIEVVVRPDSALSPSSYFFAGNSFSPDIMGWGDIAASGAGHMKSWFPAGQFFPFPAAGGSPPHLDLHMACSPVNVGWQAFYTVYYLLGPTT